MTTEQRDVAAEFMAATAGGTPAPPAQTEEAGAPPQEGGHTIAPWGTLHSDPAEAISALEADPQWQAAAFSSSHPGHKAAIAARSRLYAQLHGSERGDTIQGNGWGAMSPAMHEAYQEPGAEEMAAAYANTAAASLQRHGLDAETAQGIAELAITSGLNVLDVSDVAEAVAGSREYASPEAAIAELGPRGAEIIRAAQQEANRLRLPADLLNLPVSEHLVLGEHPRFVAWLARRQGVR